jgi:hypothetical protein
MIYIIPFRDYRLLNWLKMNSRVKLERFFHFLMTNGLSEIEAGQFVNEYVTKGILVKLDGGLIKVNCGLQSNVRYTFRPSNAKGNEVYPISL